MKLFILISACLVAYAAAECNTLAKLKVKRQWAEAFGSSEEREAFGLAIWRYVFHIKPDLPHDMFERVHGEDQHSPEFGAHSSRVLSSMDLCVSLLTDEAPLQAQLEHLRHQHDAMEIPAELFDIFSKGVRLSVHSLLGRCFDEKAWGDCMDVIENGIKHH